MRKIIADFENNYDIEKYNPVNYYKWIQAPIQIHQGNNDDAVPLSWSDQLNQKLMNLDVEVDYYRYDNADHNLMPDGWGLAAEQTQNFFRSN